ncbi:MAG: NAD(P)-dependent oxidoreductase [Magnetospirillum sp.]|nr:NAD(P)-dependent oxidoreductase [Magnetospirillum sp.]
MAQVLIVGASGLIGRALSRELIARGHTVAGFALGEQFMRDRDAFAELSASNRYTFTIGSIFDRHLLRRAMAGCDTVIHLAAMTHPVKTEAEPLHCMDINLTGTRIVLDACVETGVGHVVFASTSAVYGEPAANPVDESAEVHPRSVYSVSKLAAETLVRGYAHDFPGLGFTIARLFNVYGEGGSRSFALNAFVANLREGLAPVVFGDGSQVRCYTHADDIAAAFAAMVELPVARGKLYNIGNPAAVVSIADLARKVIATIAPDSGLDVVFRPVPAERQARSVAASWADSGKATAELGYAPRIGLDDGIRRVAQESSPPGPDVPQWVKV